MLIAIQLQSNKYIFIESIAIFFALTLSISVWLNPAFEFILMHIPCLTVMKLKLIFYCNREQRMWVWIEKKNTLNANVKPRTINVCATASFNALKIVWITIWCTLHWRISQTAINSFAYFIGFIPEPSTIFTRKDIWVKIKQRANEIEQWKITWNSSNLEE